MGIKTFEARRGIDLRQKAAEYAKKGERLLLVSAVGPGRLVIAELDELATTEVQP